MSEYYTPEIEDLFVGYECEWTSASAFSVKRNSEGNPDDICDGKMTGHDLAAVLQWWRMEHYDLDMVVRTPYLTKEQIEDKWETQEEDSHGSFSAAVFHKGIEYSLLWTSDHMLSIFEGGDTVFRGDCRSINEFRYVCRLLNIEYLG